MARTIIQTTLRDTVLGSPNPDDSICMLCVPGVATTGGTINFELDTPYLVTSLKDVTDMGVTQANNPDVYRHVSEFYGQVANGSKLWVVGYAIASMSDSYIGETFPAWIKSTAETNYGNRPRIVGWAFNYSTPILNGTLPISALITTILQDFQTTLDNLFQDSYQAFRMAGVLDAAGVITPAGGINAVPTSGANSLPNLGDLGCNAVALQITTSTPGTSASIGQTLGKCASVNIATSIGITNAGQISQTGYFIDGSITDTTFTPINTNVVNLTGVKAIELGEKQYLFTRLRQQRAGVYYNDDATCNNPLMALSAISRKRVGNAICDDVENAMVTYINQNAPVTISGDIEAGYRDSIISYIDSTYIRPRRINNEVNDVQIRIAARNNNLVETGILDVTVRIQPMGVIKEIYIDVSFSVELT